MFNIGPLELIVVLIIALIVLGPHRLPEVARSVGRGMREFRSALEHGDDDDWEPEPEPAEHALEPATTPEPATAAAYQKEAESSESSSSSSGRV